MKVYQPENITGHAMRNVETQRRAAASLSQDGRVVLPLNARKV